MYERVAELAAKRGISICKLERMANISNGTIGKWRTVKSVKVDTLVKVAKALDVSVDYLMGITEEQ